MILVTGGAGYIGSHCVLALLEKGYEVVIFDNLSTGHREIVERLSAVDPTRAVFHQGDLLNPNDLDRVFSHKIDAVFHLAAFSQVGESVKNPAKYYRNNVVGTLNLLDTMIAHNVYKIVFSSTASIYGEPQYSPIDEEHPKQPINPYGHTKLILEKIMDDYDKAYGLKSVRLRYFNVAGADQKARVGEWHDPETHLIPNILKSALGNSEAFEIYGNDYDTKDGTCVRDYVNVEDIADAHLHALQYLADTNKTDCFNLGTKEGNSIKEVFELSKKVAGKDIAVNIKARRPGDPAILVADSTKAKEVLKWAPKHTLEDSIESAYEWEKLLQHENKDQL